MRWSAVFYIPVFIALSVVTGYVFKESLIGPGGWAEQADRFATNDYTPRQITGIPPLDQSLLIGITVFFRDALFTSPAHTFAIESLFSALFVVSVWQSVQFDRYGMWFTSLYFFLYQFVGVGICMPIFLVYYTLVAHNNKPRVPATSGPRVTIQLWSMIISFVLMRVLQRLPNNTLLYFYTLLAFLVVPSVMPLLAIPLRAARTSNLAQTRAGRRQFLFLLAFVGGISFLFYVVGIVELVIARVQSIDDIVASWNSLVAFAQGVPSYVTTSSSSLSNMKPEILLTEVTRWIRESNWFTTSGHYLITMDGASFFMSSLLLVLMDGGFGSLMKTLFLTPVLSPGGSLAMYFFSREYTLAVEAPVVAASSSSPNSPSRPAKKVAPKALKSD